MAEKQRHSVIPRTLVFVFRNGKLLLIKYSGKGEHQTKEKEDRRDIYNALGGHIEANEDIIDNARREAKEEAGVDLINPRIKGISDPLRSKLPSISYTNSFNWSLWMIV